MRDLLDDEIGAAPASTLDVDSVIAVARRRNRRRMLAPAGAALAVVALSAVFMAARPTLPPIAIDPSPSAAASASISHGPPATEEERLAAVLTERLNAAVPGLELHSRVWTGGAPSPGPWTPGVTVVGGESEGGGFYYATVRLTLGDTVGILSFRRDQVRGGPSTCAEVVSSPNDECDTFVGPLGQQIFSHGGQYGERILRGARAYWPDLTVQLLLSNHESLPGDPILAAEVPLTLDDLESIVADPRLAARP